MAGTQDLTADDVQLVQLIIKNGVLTEAQIKAAYDYQRSVGGSITDIFLKLGMLRAYEVEQIQKTVAEGSEVIPNVERRGVAALTLDSLDASALKIHHRVLDKVPSEFVHKYLMVVFFPCREHDSRRLILGHGRETPEAVITKVQSILGVEIYSLSLDAPRAARWLVEYIRRARKDVPDSLLELAAQETEPQAEPKPRMTSEHEVTLDLGDDDEAEATAPASTPVPEAAPTVDEKPAETAEAPASVSDAESVDVGPAVTSVVAKREGSVAIPLVSPPPAPSEAVPPRADSGVAEDSSTQDTDRRLLEEIVPSAQAAAVDSQLALQWEAACSLLVKKKILTREEIDVEMALLRRMQR